MILDAEFKEKQNDIIINKSSLSSALEDYDKAIRNIVSINAHATGIILPTNDIRTLNLENLLVIM